jgi:hypothetical protein
MSFPLYTHNESSRRPLVAIAAALGLGMTAFGFAYRAPWPFLAIVAVAGLMALAMFVSGRKSGSELTSERLFLYAGTWQKTIAVSAIESFRTVFWSDGPDSVYLRIKGEAEFLVPSYCFNSANALTKALSDLGILRT